MSAFEVWGASSVSGPGQITKTIAWSGGRGWLIVYGLSAQPGVALSLTPDIGLTIPGLSPVTVDGTYAFEAPPCSLSAIMTVGAGETLGFSYIQMAEIKP